MKGAAVRALSVPPAEVAAGDSVRVAEGLLTVACVEQLGDVALLCFHGGEGLLVSTTRRLTVLRPVGHAVPGVRS